MPLIDLKTNLKSLKYGQDRPGGESSGQPFITTDIDDIHETRANVLTNNILNIVGINSIQLPLLPNIGASLSQGRTGRILNSVVNGDDFIRGGALGATQASINDAFRIGGFLTTLPKGPLFIAKQAGLQFSNPKLEVKRGIAGVAANTSNLSIGGLLGTITGGLLGPTRIYNLGINTLAQIPVSALGGHITRHGFSPITDDSSKYEAVTEFNNSSILNGLKLPYVPSVNEPGNRLLRLSQKFKLGNKPQSKNIISQTVSGLLGLASKYTGITIPNYDPFADNIIDSYLGGPGSVYGIGGTTINRIVYTADAGKIELAYKQSTQHAGKTRNKDNGDISSVDYSRALGINSTHQKQSYAISTYSKSIKEDSDKFTISKNINNSTLDNISKTPTKLEIISGSNKVQPSIPSPKNTEDPIALEDVITTNTAYSRYAKIVESKNFREDTYTLNGNPVNAFGIYGNAKNQTEKLPDNDKKVVYVNGKYNEVVTINKNWDKATREIRVGSGRKDSINLTPLFYTTAGSYDASKISIPAAKIKDQTVNDLVKFQIQAVDTEDITKSVWMIFRAYLGEISDDVNASWTDVSYAGRGDKFYIYDSFSRKMNVTFKVAALSYDEMKPMYQKLNYLMGNLMPDYGIGHVLRGPLVRMTIGNYIDGQLAKLDSLSYRVTKDSPWEIAINDTELVLPHIIEVSLGFTPIGSQTRDKNEIPSKSPENKISHIAQNWNATTDNAREYISPASSSIYKLT